MTTLVIAVRDATLRDVPVIATMQIAMALETEGKHLDPATVAAGVEAPIHNRALARQWVAVANGGPDATSAEEVVLGTLMITYERCVSPPGRVYWVQSVYTMPEHRNRGAFRALFQHVKDVAMSDPTALGVRLYVENDNAKAAAVYRSLGMHAEPWRMLVHRGDTKVDAREAKAVPCATVTVRPARPDDTAAIAALVAQLDAECGNDLRRVRDGDSAVVEPLDTTTDISAGVHSILAENGIAAQQLVAEISPGVGIASTGTSEGAMVKEVIATMTVFHEWSDWRNGVMRYLSAAFVAPPHRGRGVLRSMVEHVLATARADPTGSLVRALVDGRQTAAVAAFKSALGFDEEHYVVMRWDCPNRRATSSP